jgi:hypothetical protein
VDGDLVVDEGDILNMIEEELPLGNKITTPLETRAGVFAELTDPRFNSVLLIDEGSALHQSRFLASRRHVFHRPQRWYNTCLNEKIMFKSRSDRNVVTLLMEVNLVALESWLRRDSDIEDINFAQESQQQETELSPRYLEYYIDILPRGEKSEMYFDRAKAAFSNYFDGYAPLGADERYFLEWGIWREYISIKIDGKPVILAPIQEVVDLQRRAKLKEQGEVNDFRPEQKIQVPIEFDGDEPRRFISVVRSFDFLSNSIVYRNEIIRISYIVR